MNSPDHVMPVKVNTINDGEPIQTGVTRVALWRVGRVRAEVQNTDLGKINLIKITEGQAVSIISKKIRALLECKIIWIDILRISEWK